MVAVTGRRQFGLYTNGQAQYGNNTNFSYYNYEAGKLAIFYNYLIKSGCGKMIEKINDFK